MTRRFAILSSAGGSAFLAAHEVLHHHQFRVLTDRACGMEPGCDQRGIARARIEEPDNRLFSERAAADLVKHGPFDGVFLFFSRLVTEPLISRFPLVNFHPALLPAFRGFSALQQALIGGAKFFGATAHRVSEGIDDGPIIAQTCQPLGPGMSGRDLDKAAFIHKVYLLLLCVELLETGSLKFTAQGVAVAPKGGYRAYANPALANPRYLDHVQRLQAAEGVTFA